MGVHFSVNVPDEAINELSRGVDAVESAWKEETEREKQRSLSQEELNEKINENIDKRQAVLEKIRDLQCTNSRYVNYVNWKGTDCDAVFGEMEDLKLEYQRLAAIRVPRYFDNNNKD